jgi:hypothetical protein
VSIGHQVNQRFLDHQLEACQCAPDATTLQRVVLPSIEDGLAAPGLRFGEPRTMALLACLCCFQHLFAGLTNRSLRELIARLIPGYSARQMTYDLRRLQRKGVHPADPPHPAIPADQPGTPTGRLFHQDLHADRHPIRGRARPRAARHNRRPGAAGQSLASIRARTPRHNRRCRDHA